MIRRNVLTVNRILAAIVLVLAVCVNAHAQQQTPSVLLHSAQCLAANKFLPASKAAMLSFGYVVDQKSYPARKSPILSFTVVLADLMEWHSLFS